MTLPAGSTIGGRFARLALRTTLTMFAVAPALRAQEDSAFFRVPAAPDAAVRADQVLELTAERDWLRVVEELQVLFEQHHDAVLPERFHDGVTSQYTLHPGAADWALALLTQLPEEARERYASRFGAPASAALTVARDELDRRALAEVARRYPLTPAAVDALVALGDVEASRGDLEAALSAWRRADALAGSTVGASPALGSRLGAGDALGIDAPERDRSMRLPGDAAGRGPAPLAGGDRWEVTGLSLEPFDRLRNSESYSLFPILADGRLLVSTTFALHCLDAFTSEHLWTATPARRFEDLRSSERRTLTSRINRSKLLVAPAAGASVAVAALQVPTRFADEHQYQGIDITGPIPERRLFAFDLETGAPLWNHQPPEDWDGEAGSFAERMIVAGPPVVHGSRVLVPCYRMRGRIDFHVACYDLLTGARLWSTGLISGQDDLNMFGRQEEEFCGAPVVIEGDEVYVLTQLGTLARLDLFTGRIVWESRYEVIPIPKNDGWHETRRSTYWKNAPPALTTDVLVATPLDSRLLLGADRETGAILWSYDYNDLDVGQDSDGERIEARTPYNVLLGADDDTVYVGGSVVSALTKPGGLRFKSIGKRSFSREPFRARWSFEVGSGNRPRPVLGKAELILHTHGDRYVVDRRTGRPVDRKSASIEESDRGNVLLGDGVLVAVGNRRITASFDWEILLARSEAALARNPDGVEPRVEHAGLLLRRAQAHVEAAELQPASRLLARARESLDELRAKSPDPRVSMQLFEVLREDAHVRTLAADADGAITALTKALALAPSLVDVRDTLLAQEGLFRHRDPAQWNGTLEALLARCASLTLPATRIDLGLDWLVGESLFEVSPADLRSSEIPIGLWVLFTRAEARARSHDFAGAHLDLHAAIARYGEVQLAFGLDARDVAAARIARRIELDGRAPYAVFESQAGDLLAKATSEREPALFAEVGRLYPHSRAAARAEEMRLDLALASGDGLTAAGIAYARLAAGDRLTPADAALCLRLADLFRAGGNSAFEAGVIRRLAATLPGTESSLPRHGARTFAELARELDQALPDRVPSATFDVALTRTAVRRGHHAQIGVLLSPAGDGESAPEVLRILLDRRTVIAYSSADPSEERWRHQLELNGTPSYEEVAFSREAGGVIVAGNRHGVVALDAATGDLIWDLELPQATVEGVAIGSGTALVRTSADDPAGGADINELHAVELRSGVPLWTVTLENRSRLTGPIVSDGLAVLLEPLWSRPSPAIVIDMARGRVLREIDLGVPVVDDSWHGAWIEDGRLIVPFFSTYGANRESRLLAFDLATGAEAWSLSFPRGFDLRSVAAHAGRSFLITRGNSTAGAGGEIQELDVRTGRARSHSDLRPDEEVIGVAPRGRTELEGPALFTYTLRPGANSVPARMIPLDSSSGWVYQLQVPYESIYAGEFPYPALSERLIAFVYPTRNPDSFAREDARMELVDRRGGFHRGTLTLSPELSRSTSFALFGLGQAVLTQGSGGRRGGESTSRLEVLETIR